MMELLMNCFIIISPKVLQNERYVRGFLLVHWIVMKFKMLYSFYVQELQINSLTESIQRMEEETFHSQSVSTKSSDVIMPSIIRADQYPDGCFSDLSLFDR